MYVYKTTNLINGKIYIGLSTQSVEESTSYIGSGIRFLEAVENYGKENFAKEILQYCTSTDTLRIAEIYWIKRFDSTNPSIGYNLSPGGDLCSTSTRKAIYKYSIEGDLLRSFDSIEWAVNEISDKNIYRKNVRENRPIKGYWYSTTRLTKQDVIDKHALYEANKTLAFKEAARKRLADPLLAELYKKNLKEARKHVKNFSKSEETKRKISNTIKGYKWYYNPNDPTQTKQASKCPDGWLPGRKPAK